jgi:predicted RNA-binding protein with RPS1 domain
MTPKNYRKDREAREKADNQSFQDKLDQFPGLSDERRKRVRDILDNPEQSEAEREQLPLVKES